MAQGDRYRVIGADSLAELDEKVTKALNEGYKCQGGPFQAINYEKLDAMVNGAPKTEHGKELVPDFAAMFWAQAVVME